MTALLLALTPGGPTHSGSRIPRGRLLLGLAVAGALCVTALVVYPRLQRILFVNSWVGVSFAAAEWPDGEVPPVDSMDATLHLWRDGTALYEGDLGGVQVMRYMTWRTRGWGEAILGDPRVPEQDWSTLALSRDRTRITLTAHDPPLGARQAVFERIDVHAVHRAQP